MTPIWTIAKKELSSYFDSLIAYIIIIAFLGFSGFFTWLYGSDIFIRKEADLQVFFTVARWTLFFFIPAITMKLIAEEKRSGTIELLLTKNVTEWDVVLGKFLSAFLMVCIALLFTLPYYVTVASIGNIDHGATLCGYLGLLLMSATYIGIGLFASSITNNQIVAFLLALFIGVFFHFLFDVMSSGMTGWLGSLFSTLSLSSHIDSISRGLIDSKDIIYFLSITVLGLLLSEYAVRKRN
jgi:ABC-2 type transport system permease protein